MKSIEKDEDEDPQSRRKFNILMFIGYPATIIFIVLFCILIDSYIIFSFAVILEIALFVIVFAYQPITGLISLCRKRPISNEYSQSEDSQNRSNSHKAIDDLSDKYEEEEEEEEEDENSSQNIFENSIFFVASLNGMFITHFKGHKNCCNTSRSFKVISSVLVILSQIFIIVHQYYSSNMSLSHVIVMAIFKLCLIYKLCAYNFLDFVNIERVLYSLRDKKAKVTYFIVLFLTMGAATLPATAIGMKRYSNPVNSALFIETNETWLKYRDEKIILPQSFCSVQAPNGGLLHTDDLAMLTTLPRLYNVSDGKCYLIPSKRGLFNSTMKYIFGKNYEKDGIRIMCRIMPHYPILIITSDKILNDTLSYYPKDSNIIFLEAQFEINNTNYFENFTDINNTNYFPNFIEENLVEETEKLLNSYNECIEVNGTENCENEWDAFIQFYWPNFHSDKYEEISGFEKYQINIAHDMIIQPSFIMNGNISLAGTHYIVGGGNEDKWGSAFYVETWLRSLMPELLDNFLMLFSTMRKLFRDVFLGLEWINRQIFYIDLVSLHEMSAIAEMYSQFNFSHESLFAVGHSIFGTAIKGNSFFNDVQGIVFEATDGENNINVNDNFNPITLKKSISNPFSQITNIYSDSNWYARSDENCDVNGILAERYHMPDVYDTACLVSITCSQTKKYVPLCKQVLYNTLEGNLSSPEKEFQKTFDAYLEYHGYN